MTRRKQTDKLAILGFIGSFMESPNFTYLCIYNSPVLQFQYESLVLHFQYEKASKGNARAEPNWKSGSNWLSEAYGFSM